MVNLSAGDLREIAGGSLIKGGSKVRVRFFRLLRLVKVREKVPAQLPFLSRAMIVTSCSPWLRLISSEDRSTIV